MRTQNTIQEGEKDEVNLWLERTQWLPYLVGMERPELMACIEEPVAEPDPRQEQQAEPVEAAMWAAMEGLARFSQASVIHRIGVFVRLEAIWTEKHQTRFYLAVAAEALVEAAERSVEGEEEEEEEEEEEVEDEDEEDETMADVDEAIDEIETDTAKPTTNAISKLERLLSI
ncbi:uncharacterized protein EKO05_0005586 [Ascochyta rabiei]|uniref:uncharacterized protein n=1 Tax=Didymella rabiei TaxID=5454 RepID=UPI001902BF99|nr:uncharacterized protein EKO05_0005586 [Ascochyta rabiei]UPX15127.1 hypothetical protein EKO05_0005586 [Ascochyta rabiei]